MVVDQIYGYVAQTQHLVLKEKVTETRTWTAMVIFDVTTTIVLDFHYQQQTVASLLMPQQLLPQPPLCSRTT